MKYKHYNITTLLREPKKVLPDVEKGPVMIRRQNKDDLVLMTADDFHKMFDVAIAARARVDNQWEELTRVEDGD